jgi:hypothetical protein
MLLALHSALWWGFGNALSRSLMLAHLGLFLIWQPLWNREQQLPWRGGFVFVVATISLTLWLTWWLMTAWVLVLIALVGGRVVSDRAVRYAYLAALLFLVLELLLGCIPALFSLPFLPGTAESAIGYGLYLLPLSLLVFPARSQTKPPIQAVDFFYGLIASLLACVLVLGSLLIMSRTDAPYPVALFHTVSAIALFLLAIDWLWLPRLGFGGLGQLWERYLMNIGTPVESWLDELAHKQLEQQTPGEFLQAAIRQFARLPWVAGITWHTPTANGQLGAQSPHAFSIRTDAVEGIVYSRRAAGTALRLHANLLMRLVAHFYRAKEREQQLSQKAHLEAIHETGSRITHDIKNLLQSLLALAMALESDNQGDLSGPQLLLRRQLPHIIQRLRLALDKLQTPREMTNQLSALTLETAVDRFVEELSH